CVSFAEALACKPSLLMILIESVSKIDWIEYE
ncbi:MAG: hypothetical protein RLZZ181_280, partial [Pseudomonadota bacterium]